MHLWHDIPIGEGAPRTIQAVVTTPQGAKQKYELDAELGLLRATQVLYGAVQYPANFGFIPRTLGEDGRALDVLMLGAAEVAPTTLVTGRVIGVMPMLHAGARDDKIIAVQLGDSGFESTRDLGDLPPFRMNEVMRFFGDYKALEERDIEAAAPLGQEEARRIVEDAAELYRARRREILPERTRV